MRLQAALSAVGLIAGLAAVAPAAAQAPTPVKVLLDWAWLPYHAPFLIAQDKGYYKEAGLDVTLEQGRGSATTALLLSQGGFDIAHLNVTNAAQMIGKGGAITAVGLYQHKTAAAFIGIKGKAKLDGPQSLRKLKIGSTPGGSDALSLRIFTAANGMKVSDLNVVALDANAKTTALFGGTIDVVSGDSPAFDAYVRATGQEPVDLHLLERCIDYNQGLLALSTPPGDPGWGHQSTEEWTKLVSTLKSAGELPGDDKPVAAFFTNDYVPK
jgi:NitT/TauT family transport system substrate-binding protein